MADENRARWTRLVADFESCDLSQREFADERGLSLSNLRYWLCRLRKESRPLRTDETERESVATGRTGPPFHRDHRGPGLSWQMMA